LLLGLVVVINAVRIASIFVFAEWKLAHAGDSADTWDAVDAFHSSAGLFLYAAVVATILPLLYRWAGRQTRVRTAVRESDGPDSP
jgi:hypothetical protein